MTIESHLDLWWDANAPTVGSLVLPWDAPEQVKSVLRLRWDVEHDAFSFTSPMRRSSDVVSY